MCALITVENKCAFEASQDETVLDALKRSGIAFSAPCGGRGICGKCRVALLKGTVRLAGTAETNAADTERYAKPGEFFSTCMGTALSDITIELPDENNSEENSIETQESIAAKTGSGKISRAGIAIDIGTTTVQAELIDLDSEKCMETMSALNAQRSFGSDVMSRINAARKGQTRELFTAINRQTENILKYFIRKWELPGIEQCTVSGNTTMLHLFAGIDPSPMGEVPFTPVFLEERRIAGSELSLSAERITILPGISAFVGADIVSGLAFLDILNRQENSLIVDIGTNGEMALWKSKEKTILCCSTAAGPCFEGAEISCGMGALPGAINSVNVKEKPVAEGRYFDFGPLRYTTLGNIPAKGICGSGLIDAMAAMKNLGIIDETGALTDDYTEAGFPLTEGIVVSQKDIRQFQLAKSAILSGITVLCERAGIETPARLDTVYIAGGLGFFINLKNAVTAGLLPPGFAETYKGKSRAAVCGNTSLKGAVKCLSDPTFLKRCREIISVCKTVELASGSDFSEAFAENMYF